MRNLIDEAFYSDAVCSYSDKRTTKTFQRGPWSQSGCLNLQKVHSYGSLTQVATIAFFVESTTQNTVAMNAYRNH